MRLRRCHQLTVELDQEPRFSFASLLGGGDGLDRDGRWLALAGDARTSRIFRRRFAVHYQKEWAAAFALDPANAVLTDNTWTFPLALRDLPEPTAPSGAPLEFNFGPKDKQRIMQPTHILSSVVELSTIHCTTTLPPLAADGQKRTNSPSSSVL